jgi:hypothetical protein
MRQSSALPSKRPIPFSLVASLAHNATGLRRGNPMKKTITTFTAAAFLGVATLAPMPASAFIVIPFFVPALLAKQDHNFKAQNPYAAKKVVKRSHRHAKKK